MPQRLLAPLAGLSRWVAPDGRFRRARLTAVLLVLYPVFDVAAAVVDVRSQRVGASRSTVGLVVNITVSTLAALGLAVAGGGRGADLLEAMQQDAGEKLAELRVDGGATANNLLMQFQADVLGVPVVRPRVLETTALGAAYLAGLTIGLWRSPDEIAARWEQDRRFEPQMDQGAAEDLLGRWRAAVRCTVRCMSRGCPALVGCFGAARVNVNGFF